MKMTPVKIVEVEGEGLLALLNQRITTFCSAYIYTGELIGVNDSCVKLKDASIRYQPDGTFEDMELEKLYQKKPFSRDWHFHMSLPLKGKLTRKQFITRLRLGAALGFL